MDKYQKEKSQYIAFELLPGNFNISPFINGYIPISLKPEKNAFLSEIVQAVAKFGNEYVIEKHKGKLIIFNFGEALSPNGHEDYNYRHIVYSKDTKIDVDIKKDIEMAMFKFSLSLTDSNSVIQQDIFNSDSRSELLDSVDIEFKEAKVVSDEFIKKNNGKRFGESISVISENFNVPINLGHTIRSPIIKNITQDNSVYEALCTYKKADFASNKIEVTIIEDNKPETRMTTFHLEDAPVMDKFKASIMESKFINVKYKKQVTSAASKDKLIAVDITPSDGPKGTLL